MSGKLTPEDVIAHWEKLQADEKERVKKAGGEAARLKARKQKLEAQTSGEKNPVKKAFYSLLNAPRLLAVESLLEVNNRKVFLEDARLNILARAAVREMATALDTQSPASGTALASEMENIKKHRDLVSRYALVQAHRRMHVQMDEKLKQLIGEAASAEAKSVTDAYAYISEVAAGNAPEAAKAKAFLDKLKAHRPGFDPARVTREEALLRAGDTIRAYRKSPEGRIEALRPKRPTGKKPDNNTPKP